MRRFAITFVLATAAIGSLVAQTRPAPKPYTTWTQYAGFRENRVSSNNIERRG